MVLGLFPDQILHLKSLFRDSRVPLDPFSWFTKFSPLLPPLVEAGLWGLEAFSSEIDQKNHELLMALAEQHGLAVTGGSDNHGTLKPYARLGRVGRHGGDVYEELGDWIRDGQDRSEQLHGPEL